jgi:PBP1b-binding outer membrane lipoprotein LpoB
VRLAVAVLLGACLLTGCGYHTSGHADLVPKTIHTIAIPAFTNITTRYRITDRLPEAIAREFISRTHYQIVNDPGAADAVLYGSVINYFAYPIIFDPVSGRAATLQFSVLLQMRLVERTTGKVIFSRPNFEAKQQYEISVNQNAYFEESPAAIDRMSREVARTVVAAILENF